MIKLTFVIDYRTQWGQDIYVCGDAPELGQWDEGRAVKMYPASGEQWRVEMEVSAAADLHYKFFLKDENNGFVAWEFGQPRRLALPPHITSAYVRDFWRPAKSIENALYSSPFTKAFFRRDPSKTPATVLDKSAHYVRLKLRAPRVGKDYQVGIVGSGAALGNWDESKVVLMNDMDYPVWKADIAVTQDELQFEYKYVIYSHKEKRIVTWENGSNRYLPLHTLKDSARMIIYTDEFFRYPVGNWKTAGVAIPVFSIRSETGAGVGEFSDIRLLVDWAVKTGMKMVQILPVNDTIATKTWTDSYPYAAISVEALHPIYANLPALGKLKDKKQQKEMEAEMARLNALPEVDYEAVMSLKMRYFQFSFEENADVFLKSKAFKDFAKSNERWLPAYAAFSALRDQFGTPDFSKWGAYQHMTDAQLKEFVKENQPHYHQVALYYYIQFHLDKQLKEASAYAREHGVVLKGDIPIGIYRFSVDAWRMPHLFNMDCQAGAPPDDFSITGQNWGFPTYNWDEMAKDGFAWWRERMVKMSEYFDVFRIDHILGFFRIWEIPEQYVEGLMGRFNPALPFDRRELANWGIPFDDERYTRPYIRRHMVFDIFGSHAEGVFRDFLNEYEPGKYAFVAAFDTQRKLKLHFDQLVKAQPENADFLNWMRYNLYRLHGEVLFLEAPLSEGQAFTPRIAFHSTYSFQELDEATRRKLDELYIHFFYHRHNDFWRESAMRKLPMLRDATDMLICGEDLGMVPACVPGVMDDLQILSLCIQRMPNDDREFWHPADTPYMSVTSTGSHDTSTLREWWQENPEATQRFYNHILGHGGAAPYYCEPWLAKDVINQHLQSPSMLAIFPLQDLVAMDGALRRPNPNEERINIPANPTHYWRYRFHLSVQQLLEEDGFNAFLRQLVDQGGRKADY